MKADRKIYLDNTNFQQKDELKKLGALWDYKNKKWFIPVGSEINKFEKFLNQNSHNMSQKFDEYQILKEFKLALEKEGFLIDDLPIMDGKIHRVKVKGDKGRETSGAYKGFLDGYPAGFIQNFKTGISFNWKTNAAYHNINPHETQTLPNNKNYTNENLEKQYQLGALSAREIFQYAQQAHVNHSYLQRKQINDLNHIFIKQDNYGNLLIPLTDIKGDMQSLQTIFKNGDKIIGTIKSKESKDKAMLSRKKGCFHIVGATNINTLQNIQIAEGFATAWTIYKATNNPTIMSIDSGNLSEVVKVIKDALGHHTQITIFADNDKKSEEVRGINIGLEKAFEVKQNFKNITIKIPKFTQKQIECGMSDFNDLYVSCGLMAVKEQLKVFNFSVNNNNQLNFKDQMIANYDLERQD